MDQRLMDYVSVDIEELSRNMQQSNFLIHWLKVFKPTTFTCEDSSMIGNQVGGLSMETKVETPSPLFAGD